jgi:acid phosphatase
MRSDFRFALSVSLFAIMLAAASAIGCGGSTATPQTATTQSPPSPPGTPPPPTPPPPPPPPAHGPVVLVVEENHAYSSVIGSSAMPYLNSLANQYSLATQYFADTHPSIGNYMMMTAGQIITNDDSFNGPVSVDNIVRHLLQSNKTWKAYAESLPSVGYTGGDALPYVHRHNPLSYFTDVTNSATQQQNLVPFTQFATDLQNRQLPHFSFVAPNVNNDAHDGTLQQADSWLQSNIGPLFSNPQFQQGGLLIVVFDESVDTDSAHGGGQVAMVVAGPLVKKGFQTATFYQHENMLKFIATYLGINTNIGAAGGASAMSEVLQ